MAFALIGKIAYFLLLGLLILFMIQKRYGDRGAGKRLATLYLSAAVLAVYVAVILLVIPNVVPRSAAIAAFFATATVATTICVMKRKKVFPARLHCVRCGSRLPLERSLFLDSNFCEACEKDEISRKI